MSLVWEMDFDHAELLISLALADHADDDGRRSYPSLPYVAWKTGYSVRQIRRVLVKMRSRA